MASGSVRVLMVSSEVESLARTGGLGDAVEALSKALGILGADVVVVTPKYGVTRLPADVRLWERSVMAPLGLGHARELGVLETRLGDASAAPASSRRPSATSAANVARPTSANHAPRVCLLCDSELYDRDGIYGDRRGTFTDNPFRFATLASGALSVAERAWGGELPHVVHAHDWHAALAVIYARRTRGPAWARVPTALTIHNLAFQGVFPPSELAYVAIPHDLAALPNMDPTNPLRPAFLQTSNSAAEIDLLRYYTDEGYQGLYPVDGGGAGLADASLAITVGSSTV